MFRVVISFALITCLAGAWQPPTRPGTGPAPAAQADEPRTPKLGKPGGDTTAPAREKKKMPALDFRMKDIDGKEQDLRQYYGQVVLMVNTASKCGYTPQYRGLEALYAKYRDRGFVVLAFPANNFGGQEPGTNAQIKEFCKTSYGVTFPVFSKVSVRGEDICPLYKYLTDRNSDHRQGGDVAWNFTKFLVGRSGRVIARFDTRVTPENDKLHQAVEKALGEAIPEDSPLAAKIKKDQKARKAGA